MSLEHASPAGGTWFVAPTPFDADGRLDADSLRSLASAVARWGCDGVTVLGVMGEVATLTDTERETVQRTVAETVGAVLPMAVGCSGVSAHLVGERIAAAAQAGAAAAMVSAPPGSGDVSALPAFFQAVAERSPLPLIIQDEPTATGVRLPVPVLLDCIHAAGISTVKLEDPPTPSKISRLLAADPGLRVFGGLGGVSSLAELRRGAVGTMTGFAFPEILRALRLAVADGRTERSAQLFDTYLPLLSFEGQPGGGLGIRKEVLRRRGVIGHAVARIGPPPDPVTLAELDDVLARVGVVPGPDRWEVP